MNNGNITFRLMKTLRGILHSEKKEDLIYIMQKCFKAKGRSVTIKRADLINNGSDMIPRLEVLGYTVDVKEDKFVVHLD